MKKNKLNWIIASAVGIVFLIIWINIVDWPQFVLYFQKVNVIPILLFSFFYLLAFFFRSIRWKIILNPIYKIHLFESYAIFMSGLLINYLIPVRAGEIAKSLILKINKNIRISQSLPTILIDKITDLFPILIIIFLIPIITVEMNNTLRTIIIILLGIFLLFLSFLIFSVHHKEKAIKLLNIFLKIIPLHYRSLLAEFFVNFIEGMAIMKGRYLAHFFIYLLTVCAVLSEALYIWMVFLSFGSEVSYWQILFGYTLMNLTYILPTPPAQIGSNQVMWVLIFSFALGINENLTSAAVTFSHLLTAFWIFLVGIISFLALKIKFREIVPAAKSRINTKS
ncbi:MAG: lysylphosphatidylglycerol synthase transmembrane domain-containing protein [Candidatus Cloacimonadota bacterium]|nr:lysylphosphatidylglycerol synthase transmembrane domain-containing protein [Candidatus Cloacimonadota bacterium]